MHKYYRFYRLGKICAVRAGLEPVEALLASLNTMVEPGKTPWVYQDAVTAENGNSAIAQ